MKKLNKAMSVAVAAAMMVSLGACGNSADAAKDGTQSAGASGKVYNIGICQQLEHPALDQATQGFEDVLKEKLGARDGQKHTTTLVPKLDKETGRYLYGFQTMGNVLSLIHI